MLYPGFLLLLAACTSSSTDKTDTEDSAPDTSESGTEDSGDTMESAGETDETDPGDLGALVLPDLTGYNIVYVHMDTTRYDHFPQNGYERNTLPNLSQRDWLVVDGIYGGSSWTMPSTAALLTSQPPDVNGLTDDGSKAGSANLYLLVPTVTEHLKSLGFSTALYTGNSWLTGLTDMHKGFDVSVNVPKSTTQYNLERLLEEATPWALSHGPDERFFLFLQPMDMHLPLWVDPADQGTFSVGEPPWDENEEDQRAAERQVEDALAADPIGATQMLNDVYDEQMLGWDRAVDSLLDALEESGQLANTVVIVSADHGEVLNDSFDGEVGHGVWVREELIHVPFMMLLPTGESGTVDCIAPNIDVFPTLLEAMGLPAMEGTLGASLRESCHPFAVSALWWEPERMKTITVSNGRERLERTCDDQREFGYDLIGDALEINPLPASELDLGAEMHDALEESVTRILKRYPDIECAALKGPAD